MLCLYFLYAEHYGLLEFAGSDNHIGAQQKKSAGISSNEPTCDIEDFIYKLKNRQTKIFTVNNI